MESVQIVERPLSRRTYPKIRLEACSACQLKCPSCPTASKAILPTIGNGFLRLEDFRKLVDESPWLREIELSNYGEIFLNPQLLSILEYAHTRGVHVSAENGVNLNNVREEVLEGVVKYGVRRMTCSIDGVSQSSYARYRVGGDLDTVIRNIKTINRYKAQYRSPYPKLRWQFILFGHNEHELEAARSFARSLDMQFRPKLSWDEKLSPWSDEVATGEFGVPSRAAFKARNGRDYMAGICLQLWDEPQINWDGKVLGCCRNFWGDFGGNAMEDGLQQALSGEKIEYARRMLMGQAPHRDDLPCSNCDIYLSRRVNNDWIKRPEETSMARRLLRGLRRKLRGA
ncbi:MAG: SPASM domain-containing protein [Chromatiales bacterium]|nr:SPASM domain-containing protein [Chromatiales bacterium]